MSEALINKYRPESFDEMLGQEAVISSLKKILKDGTAHTFIFTGQAGIGKTTLARIVAKEVGTLPENILEIDAATHNGVDNMREITRTLPFKGFGATPIKTIIGDEIHRLSAPAWESMLKVLEEPPPHVYWMLCTTEAHKIPKTIKTRGVYYELKPVSKDDLWAFVSVVAETEGFAATDDVITAVVNEAEGSVRQALSGLAVCADCTTRKQAIELLRSAFESDEVIEFCRWLAKGKGWTWERAMQYVAGMEDKDPESVRLQVLAYFRKALLNPKSAPYADKYLRILNAFSGQMFLSSEKTAPIILALGDIFYD